MWTKEQLQEMVDNWESKRGNWIQTFNGNSIDFSNLSKDQIDIVDIAHALSHIPRYNGHIREFYSVAQHSVLTYYLVTEMGGTTEERMQALLHDAPEAYIGDMPSPLKDLMIAYQKMERMVAKVIGEAFDIELENLSQKVHKADRIALALEAHAFFDKVEWIDKPDYNRTIPGVTGNNGELIPAHPSIGKNAFMNEFWNLKLKLDKEAE